jgi:hypothetical protein
LEIIVVLNVASQVDTVSALYVDMMNHAAAPPQRSENEPLDMWLLDFAELTSCAAQVDEGRNLAGVEAI